MDIEFGQLKLTEHAARLIHACRKVAFDGTVLFTPDGVGNYDALWTRDFGYMVEYCADLMDPEEIAEVIVFLSSKAARGVNGNIMFVDGGTDALLNSEKVY